ncbi:epoxide hydrolase family protein [Nocardia pseudobrasiliensis]|uniref:Pimeloyl-ACP methyl ester carboxylesterase n=1 Tax=Nocardia pseudobrasiliensis TaxID=45979 RepID=A0A370I1B4_9NOCA|nr:epoxide hydrolase family protein [Nocardia pseudobrasiliensis]RDI63034.1 pimeloyl-ACP methyl ester carboxylesterase [Nocardia pseudobrasiliensis]
MSTAIRPFRIDIPQSELDDLRRRLTETRWGTQLPGPGRSRGVPEAEVRDWARYWGEDFDWPAQQARLNEFSQYLTEIDGLYVHFLHIRSTDPDALPLVLNHGWPNSFVEFTQLIAHLTKTFHVVVPSVPGYAFSDAPRETGFGVDRVARMWVELMARLGYDRYGVQGGDLGSYVAEAMAKAAPEHVVGLYITAGLGFPTAADVPELTEAERAAYQALMSADWMHGVDHHALLRSAPQTFGYGWNDSPTAALAWMLQKFHDFSAAGALDESIDRDALLTNLSVYWFTRTFATSSWSYYETSESAWPTGSATVATGVYSGDPGIRRLAERTAKITHWPTGNPAGHHFIAMDRPAAYAADLRTFFAR